MTPPEFALQYLRISCQMGYIAAKEIQKAKADDGVVDVAEAFDIADEIGELVPKLLELFEQVENWADVEGIIERFYARLGEPDAIDRLGFDA